MVLCSERVTRGRQRRPGRDRRRERPVWWREVAFIALGYLLYTITRNAAPPHVAAARHNANAVYAAERWLNLDIERSLNALLARHELFGTAASYYYATLHFMVTLAILGWAYRAHPEAYRRARTVLIGSTLVALYLFWAYPLAPPRLAGLGFVDTIGTVHLWGGATWNSPGVVSVSNEYAAMPSLHVAWALWSAGVVVWLCRNRLIKLIACIYPVLTLLVVLATANHFVLDTVAALGVLLVTFLGEALARRWLIARWLPDQRLSSTSDAPGEYPSRPEPVPLAATTRAPGRSSD